ncbi:MAG: YbbR-like domain-containing protein [Dehalococcoidia bacterium]
MRRRRGPTAWLRAAASAVRKTGAELGAHWGLALVSIVAALAVWATVQDTDNPRVEGFAPATGGVSVRALNVPDDFQVGDLQTVRVRVDARKNDLQSLRPDDFEAEVDVTGVNPGATEGVPRPVTVQSRRSGVRVLGVEPAQIPVILVPVTEKDVAVNVRVVGQPPAGYEAEGAPSVDPAIVTVRGRRELVESVASVDVDVNLAAARDDTFETDAELVARTSDGNIVRVQLSSTRARVAFRVTQVFSQRTLGIGPVLTGQPAPGYVVTSVTIDPPSVQLTGPKIIVDGLRGPLTLERHDLTGAQRSIVVTKAIDRPSNVSLDRQTAVLRIDIQPIDCSAGATAGGCQGATFYVAPEIGPSPPGLAVEPAVLTVQVRVSGPLPLLATLKPADLKATVTLTGATAGTREYAVKVTAPAGIRVDSAEPVVLTLRPAVIVP